MVKLDPVLDGAFSALAHATRRAILDALGAGACTAGELAAAHDMTLAAFMKHVRALEAAGLIRCHKQGRTVMCELAPDALKVPSAWISERERLWRGRLDALGRFLYHRDQVSKERKA